MVAIEAYEIYVLWLNSVYANAEQHAPVAWADTPEALKAWEQSQLADEPYRDGGYYLRYRADSPLKHYNPAEWEYQNPWYRTVTCEIVRNVADIDPSIIRVEAFIEGVVKSPTQQIPA